jgi:hypothetical protein
MGYLKLVKILGPIIILIAVVAYIASLRHDVAKWRGRVYEIADVVQEVGGFKGRTKGDRAGKLVYKDVVPGVRKIGAQRDQYLQSLNNHKAALLDQSRQIMDLGAETRRLRDLSAQQAALVRKLTAQRNTWIVQRERASTRTQRLSADEEVRAAENALDALYQAGF